MQRRPSNEESKPLPVKPPKLPYTPAFEITKETPKGQVAGAKVFNAMRQRLIDVGEMENGEP